MIALPLAALSGLRNEQMVGALVVAGSSSAVSCFIMAKYGTRRNAYLECGHAYYAGKCFYYDSMAVCAALLRSGVGV